VLLVSWRAPPSKPCSNGSINPQGRKPAPQAS